MDVVDAGRWLAGQARPVEVVDVRRRRVEDVEQLEHETGLARYAVARFPIPQGGALRRHAALLDERARSEVSYADRAEQRPLRPSRLEGHPTRDHAIQGPWNK